MQQLQKPKKEAPKGAAKSGQRLKNLRRKKLNAREAATVRGGSTTLAITSGEPGTLKRL